MYEYLERRYALALYEIGEEKNKVEEFLKELREVNELMQTNEELKNLIKHPQISSSKKKSVLMQIFEGKVEKDILRFLILLISKNRILYLDKKLEEMEKIYLEKHNKLKAKVVTKVPLTTEQRNTLIIKLEKKYNKKVILTEKIDSKILGGIYVRVGNDIIDDTLLHKLQDMKNLILKGE